MEYFDFKNMVAYSNDAQNNKPFFVDYFRWLLESNFTPVIDRLLSCLGMNKYKTQNSDKIVEGVIYRTLLDEVKKLKSKNYYICSASGIIETLKDIFDKRLLTILSDEKVPSIFFHNYCHILHSMLFDVEELITNYEHIIMGNQEYNGAYKTWSIHYQSIHQTLRQLLFGQWSANSHCDMEPSASISTIRVLIELRIRSAFGILASIDKNGGVKPISMTMLFDVIDKQKENIFFEIKYENIKRIYEWANMYTHSGKTEPSWTTYFIEKYLHPLTFGTNKFIKTADGKSTNSISSGIRMSRQVLDTVVNEIETLVAELNKMPVGKLIRRQPECLII